MYEGYVLYIFQALNGKPFTLYSISVIHDGYITSLDWSQCLGVAVVSLQAIEILSAGLQLGKLDYTRGERRVESTGKVWSAEITKYSTQ